MIDNLSEEITLIYMPLPGLTIESIYSVHNIKYIASCFWYNLLVYIVCWS